MNTPSLKTASLWLFIANVSIALEKDVPFCSQKTSILILLFSKFNFWGFSAHKFSKNRLSTGTFRSKRQACIICGRTLVRNKDSCTLPDSWTNTYSINPFFWLVVALNSKVLFFWSMIISPKRFLESAIFTRGGILLSLASTSPAKSKLLMKNSTNKNRIIFLFISEFSTFYTYS